MGAKHKKIDILKDKLQRFWDTQSSLSLLELLQYSSMMINYNYISYTELEDIIGKVTGNHPTK